MEKRQTNAASKILQTVQFSEILKTHIGEKENKCNQCSYASSQTHLMMHTEETQTNAANITMRPRRQATREDF